MFEARTPRSDLAAALRLAAHFGFHEGVCNHFSLQLPDGSFLLSPHGKHWSLIEPADILHVEPGKASAAEVTALNIHGAIHEQHPEATCVLHTHMPFATTLTCLADNRLRFIHQNSLRFFNAVAYDDDYNGLADDAAEGERIASRLGNNQVLFLANHGVVVTGESVALAFDRLYYLERACELQVRALATGQTLRDIDDNTALTAKQTFDAQHDYAELHFAALLPLLT